MGQCCVTINSWQTHMAWLSSTLYTPESYGKLNILICCEAIHTLPPSIVLFVDCAMYMSRDM